LRDAATARYFPSKYGKYSTGITTTHKERNTLKYSEVKNV
jgi:hypothetical protein